MSDQEQMWKQKLMAFLHDPPSKCLDFSPEHEKLAWTFCKSMGITETEYEVFKGIKDTDHYASAADRFLFPKGECATKFSGKTGETFKHPLAGEDYNINNLISSQLATEFLQDSLNAITGDTWKTKFFCLWRRWFENVTERQNDNQAAQQLAYFPADTRIPDHTIWTHMRITSAFEGCRNPETKEIEPAFLIFQLGPVQDFIAQARSTRDLWSGSYMLSWLTAHAIKAVTDKYGPDSVIFPALREQGIFDVLYRSEIYDNIKCNRDENGNQDTLWQRMYMDGRKNDKNKMAKLLLNPTIPNRFAALVPASGAQDIAVAAEKAVSEELKNISNHCWAAFQKLTNCPDTYKERWDKQVEMFPQITWQTYKWGSDILADLEANNSQYKEIGATKDIFSNLEKLYKLAMEVQNKDDRYFYKENDILKIKNKAFAWSLYYAIAEHAISARRNTRNFECFKTDNNQKGALKDALSGKEEIIGDKALWEKFRDEDVFKKSEGPYGAINIVKRLWCSPRDSYLFEKLGIDEAAFRSAIRFDSMEAITQFNKNTDNPYIAVIAMDGDDMGKWISGQNTPKLDQALSANAINGLKKLSNHKELDMQRPLSPSYHLQFSEALSNFSNHIAGFIVSKYNGQLIYAGGDDVLAMLPAENALDCAWNLRKAFQCKDKNLKIETEDAKGTKASIAYDQKGFIRLNNKKVVIVPGARADLSCGIAIAHQDHPLQHTVNEAREAEKLAKHDYKKSAFAISLLKRGGETIHWGAKWDSSAIALYKKFLSLKKDDNDENDKGKLSGKFPSALAALLRPYALENGMFADSFSPTDVIKTEFEHVLKKQGNWQKQEGSEDPDLQEIRNLAHSYIAELKKEITKSDGNNLSAKHFDDFEKLFLTAAFINRKRGE